MNFKLIQSIFLLEVRKIMAYRSDFWINIIGQVATTLVVSYSLWKSIFTFQNIEVMNGFTMHALIFYYVSMPLISRTLLGEDIGFLAREIYEGSLNKYLVYPLSVFGFKNITYFVHSIFYAIQLGFVFGIFYFVIGPDHTFSLEWGNLFAGIIGLMIGSSVYFILSCSIETIAFWADNIWSLRVLLRMANNFLGGMMVPLAFFPEWALSILKYTPFPYLLTFPINTIMGKVGMEEWFTSVAILLVWYIIFFIIFRIIWARGKFQYTGVGI
jgi:ABC-2 type transport system permease protein